MQKLIISLITPLLLLPCFTSCAIANGNIEDFEGIYKVYYGYERKMHYYWGEEIEKESESLPGVGLIIYINHDKSVTYKDGGETIKGSINCYSDYCTFNDLFIDSSYQFKISTVYGEKSLEYYYRSQNSGFDYDYTVRGYSLRTTYDPEDYSYYVGNYVITGSSYKVSEINSGQSTVKINDSNYKSLVKKNINIKEDKIFTITNSAEEVLYSGTVNHESDHINLIFNGEKIFPENMNFFLSKNDNYFYINASIEINDPQIQMQYTKYNYILNSNRKIVS